MPYNKYIEPAILLFTALLVNPDISGPASIKAHLPAFFDMLFNSRYPIIFVIMKVLIYGAGAVGLDLTGFC
ncbi:MAG: hypothetical protein ABSB91_01340 [Sedimentisphaerales bacterium]